MRRLLRFGPLVAAIALLGAGGLHGGVHALASGNGATVQTFPTSGVVTSRCTGATISFNGTAHIEAQFNQQAGIEQVNLTIHSTGVDQNGNQYIANHAEQTTIDSNGSFTHAVTTVFVSEGAAPNEQVKIRVSFNAVTGTFSMSVVDDCLG